MRILKLGLIGAVCAVAYKMLRRAGDGTPAAFADGQGAPGNDTQVRDAGPDAMRDGAHRPWLREDEESDQSFPASDPPGNY